MECRVQSMYKFEIVEGHLCKTDVASGDVVARFEPIGTSIVQVLPLGENLVVREDYYNFPPDKSNVYCLSPYFEFIWSAELPRQRDAYANQVVALEDWLYCASWDGMSCTLDPKNGRIVKMVFTK